MSKKNEWAVRPTSEDLLRALGYALLAGWAFVYLLYPPPPVTDVLEWSTRIAWMTPTIIGFIAAIIGALLRIDIKLELPALVVTLPGPIFYGITQFYLIFHPELLFPSGPETRYAITLYAFVPAVLLLPRIVGLLKERKRLKRIARARAEQIALMTDSERAQPGAGLTFTLSNPVVEEEKR